MSAVRTPDREFVAPVMRVRLRYAKRGRLRFASHRDFQRTLERGLRRARIPMAYSAGFSPHPRISYANAAPTGAASEAEYAELGLAARLGADEVRADLDRVLPGGFDVVEAVEARTADFANRLQASQWEFRFGALALVELEAAVGQLLAAERIEVERMTKNGLRRFDARAAVLAADLAVPGGSAAFDRPVPASCAILTVVVAHGTPSVRPDDVLAALRRVADLAPRVPPLVTRLAQGQLASDARTVLDPLAPDRAGVSRPGTDESTSEEPGTAVGA